MKRVRCNENCRNTNAVHKAPQKEKKKERKMRKMITHEQERQQQRIKTFRSLYTTQFLAFMHSTLLLSRYLMYIFFFWYFSARTSCRK